MSHRIPVLALAAALACGVSAVRADYSTGFEGATPLAGWTLTAGTVDNGPVINTNAAFVHSGTQSLYLDWHDAAVYQFNPTDQFGTLTMWVYDLGKTLSPPNSAGADGPRWGAMNSAGVGFTGEIADRTASVNATHFQYAASDGGPTSGYFSTWDGSPRMTNAWNEFVFDRPDANTATLTINGGAPIILGAAQEGTGWLAGGTGFDSIIFSGGGHYNNTNDPLISGVYIDDVSFVAVPEPASLALMGLAGVLLLGRRRHRA